MHFILSSIWLQRSGMIKERSSDKKLHVNTNFYKETAWTASKQCFYVFPYSANANKKSKKVKSIFRAADPSSELMLLFHSNGLADLLVRSDLWVYEEVVPWPPSPIPSLLLIGPNGVGRRTIKFLLCTQFPQRFSFPVSGTLLTTYRSWSGFAVSPKREKS